MCGLQQLVDDFSESLLGQIRLQRNSNQKRSASRPLPHEVHDSPTHLQGSLIHHAAWEAVQDHAPIRDPRIVSIDRASREECCCIPLQDATAHKVRAKRMEKPRF